MPFPQRLQDARLAAGLTRKRLAEIAGVTLSTYNLWENDAQLPGPVARHKLKAALPLLGDIPEPRRREPALGGRKEPTTVYLRKDQADALRAMATRDGCSVAELIREAIDGLLRGLVSE